ncbi:MAG: methionine gamma-lyase family protein [Lachnospiraceae bacterium]|nr:methionine gamma-lyase family protein [Lachnospiraceae bacterium]
MNGNDLKSIYKDLGISENVLKAAEEVLDTLKGRFAAIDENAELCQLKVLRAFQKNNVNESCLIGTTGYGYNDIGRDTLEKVYADYFGTEDCLVRPQITCGTHALALALMSNLRPGDELLSAVGKPYDTLEEVIGIRDSVGSLAEYGITYAQAELSEDGTPNLENIKNAINDRTKLVTIQRSKGYQTRPSLSVAQIAEIIKTVKSVREDIICMVDNCYGEFVEPLEPSDVGADMVVGSLIKNPGGGLAQTGGYIAGTKKCIENASYRLTAPGLGREVGPSLEAISRLYQGFFMGPVITASAIKNAIFAAALFEKYGFESYPSSKEERHDIIQAITFGKPEGLIAFCEGIQSAAPVDSSFAPEPWDMPGYDSKVIMAAGAFISGSSIELSADGPLREPYTAYFQGGLTWPHGKFGIIKAFQSLVDKGHILC